MSRNKSKDIVSRSAELLEEANKNGGIKGMADAIGMPDEEDAFLLNRLVSIYESKTNGRIKYTLQQARLRFEIGKYGSMRNESAKVNSGTDMTYDFELPADFVSLVEKHWPTMFTDKKHYHWFKKKMIGMMIRPNETRTKLTRQ